MRRREFIGVLGGVAAWPLMASAQQPAVPVVGFLHSQSAEGSANITAPFRSGLAELDYVEGHNLRVEYRWADGQFDHVPALLDELIHRPVAVIVAAGATALAAKHATATIPIVFTTGADPVKDGLVLSLNRPDANMTGVSFFVVELGPKQLELLHELLPTAAKIGFLSNPGFPFAAIQLHELETAAHASRQQIEVQTAAGEGDLEGAFAALRDRQVDALIVGGDPFFSQHADRVVALTARYAIPAIYYWPEFAAAGGLMSYGPSLANAYHQVGAYVGRILKGAKPADLPIVQPTKINLIINLKTAKSLGLTFPLTLLGRADEVIE
jgi:putative tryptophan/tyrosine transport system substrate-binding protein